MLPTWMLTCLSLLMMAGGGYGAAEDERSAHFSARRDMVLVRATVTDMLGQPIVGLNRQDFRIFDNQIEQDIEHFTSGGAAISVGFILDTSGSMELALPGARRAIGQFLQDSHPLDEYFLIAFNDRIRLLEDLTSLPQEIVSQAAVTSASGQTALFDALYLGLEKMRQANNLRKTLIVITDTEDNFSRYTPGEIREFLLESDVQLYLLGERRALSLEAYDTPWKALVKRLLLETVQQSGGRSFFPRSPSQLEYFCSLIHQELRSQYLLGYTPSNPSSDSKWRKIKLQLRPLESFPRLSLRYKRGYFPSLR